MLDDSVNAALEAPSTNGNVITVYENGKDAGF